ncbi:MAG: riboflavin synthase [bacterium]|nr:riboflavin synthase [bacterium]
MFTGIIEEIGKVKKFQLTQKNALIEIECKKILEEIKIGDSVAINGVCQTVTTISDNSFTADVSTETLKVTNFSNFKIGDFVNLERALTLQSRLGGHIISGHVDNIAKIEKISQNEDFYLFSISLPKDIEKYVVKKGSICINGISLTVANISNQKIELAIIPHTYKSTNLQYLKANDNVNVEVDMLAKYVEKFLSRDNNSCISEDFLKENGFY